MKYSFFILLLLGFWLACKPGAKTNEANQATDTKALEDSLMAMHDVVMPKLNDIQKLSSELRTIRASVQENAEGKMILPTGLEENLESLKLAEQGMWDWMKSYHDTRDSLPAEQLETYLNHQMELIQSVNTQIDNSIKKAQDWLTTQGVTNEKK